MKVAMVLLLSSACLVLWVFAVRSGKQLKPQGSEEASIVGLQYPAAEPAELLTVPQTLGLAFLPGDNPSYAPLFFLANPEAKPFLYRIARNEAINENNAWPLIGHVGDAADVEAIRNQIDAEFKGQLTYQQLQDFEGMMDALGRLAVRDVPGARDCLIEMVDCDYWRKRNVQFYSEEVTKQSPSARYVGACTALSKIALFESGDRLADRITRLADQCEEPTLNAEMLDIGNVDRLRERAWKALHIPSRKPTQDERDFVARVFNGDFENPGPNWRKMNEEAAAEADARAKARFPHDHRRIRDPEDSELKEALEEASQAASEIQKLFARKDVDAIRPRVLKDGSHRFTPRERIDED